jgi:fructose-specific phosphotransferase system IIC component
MQAQQIMQEDEEETEGRSGFMNGLAVGLGVGCIAAFIILWTAVFFSTHLPLGIAYENLLPIFVYPLLYLLTIGLVSLTAGVVRQKFMKKH